jgi:small subunit ribosomal protein S13
VARIAGVIIPDHKRAFIGLSYIYGVGRSLAQKTLTLARVDPMKKIGELTASEIERIQRVLEGNHKIEGELKVEVTQNIKRLKEIGSYRGLRHTKNLPVRGQRTKTNARTRKGKKVTVATSRRKLLARAAQKT